MRTMLWGALAAALLVTPGVARAQEAPIELGAAAQSGTIVVVVPVIPYVLLVPFNAGAALGPLSSGAGAPFGANAPGGLGALEQGFPGAGGLGAGSSGVTSLGGAGAGSLGITPIGAGSGSTGMGFGSSSLSGFGR